MDRTRYVFFLKKNRRKNPMAKDLSDGRYHQRVVKDKIMPSVAAHKGEIKFISFHRGVVRLLLSGSCSGCAMSKVTLHRGVENMLKHYIPEVTSLIGEDDEKAEEQGYTPYFPKNKEPEWEKLAGHKYE